MKRNYEITYQLTCVVVVEGAESEEAADDFAQNEATFGDADVIESKTRVITDAADLDRSKRHANCVSRDDTIDA